MSRVATIDSAVDAPRGLFDGWRDATRRVRAGGALAVVGSAVAVTLLIAETGGAPSQLVHLLYVPVVLGAIVFKTLGGAVAGLSAGILVGLFGSVEPTGEWMTRAAFLAVVGALFGQAQDLLHRRQRHGQELVRKLASVHARTLSTFAATVDLRDKPTSGHSSRVAHNARALSRALGMGPEEIRAVYWAGLLHDLGKIAVPERILQKPTELTEDEFSTMRRHSDIGANLLLSVSPDLRPIAEGVRTHHERWNGTGYPHGLRGQWIPRSGRIIAIVDVFEALTCSRPYRGPKPVPEVLQFIRDRAGSWFDPELVPVLEDLYWKGEIFTAAAVQTNLPVEEPTVVLPSDHIDASFLRIGTADYHLGSSGRP
ncbi:MAG: HD-GYP domain-containing protein [Actinomycetota bacterium]|nr:HD-GYP domain-containing protein [Actinomycetota bacterium]